jgi:hypothetical protein
MVLVTLASAVVLVRVCCNSKRREIPPHTFLPLSHGLQMNGGLAVTSPTLTAHDVIYGAYSTGAGVANLLLVQQDTNSLLRVSPAQVALNCPLALLQ